MKSYPYIGKGIKSGSTALIYEQSKCVAIESKTWAVADFELCDGINEDCFKNITAEYLANTYGEVKSKEHAEFIVKLAEVNGIQVSVNCRDGNAKVFSFRTKSGVPRLVLLSTKDHLYNAVSRKQITIPLPPECDARKPKEVIANGKNHTLNLATGFYDFGVVDIDCATVSTLDKLKMADDYQVISFVDDVSLDSDWPKVNDVVVLGEKRGVVKLPPDAQGYYVVNVGGIYNQCKFGELSKPKQSEQELRDELINDLGRISQRGVVLIGEFLSKYNITKKPQ